MISKYGILAISSLFLISCGTKHSEPDSQTKWAHYKPNKIYQFSLLGKLEQLHKNGVFIDSTIISSKINICFETPSNLKESAMLLDLKIAYANWLNVSGRYNQTEWNRFKFLPKSNCKSEIENPTIQIAILAKKDSISPDTQIGKRPKFYINKPVTEYQGSFTDFLAFALVKDTLTTPTEEEVLLTKPVHIITKFNPTTLWLSLGDSLKLNPDLQKIYFELERHPETQTFSNLVTFGQRLNAKQMGSYPEIFKDQLLKFVNAQKVKPDAVVWNLQSAIYPYILKELGYQFGLSATDEQNGDTVHGTTLVKGAVMSRNTWNLSLTADDVESIQKATAAVTKYFSSRKRQVIKP